MWTLIMYVYFQGIIEGRAAAIESITFSKESVCQEAGQAFVKMADGPYRAKFICVRAN